MRKYYIADTHFGDSNVHTYYHRVGKDASECDRIIVDRWNSVVDINDAVFLLGDIGDYASVASELNGNVTLIMGNHDILSKQNSISWFEHVSPYPIIDGFIILSHEPLVCLPSELPYLNIHGHTHTESYGNFKSEGKWNNGCRHFCVSVEQIDYTPISDEQIIERMG